MKYKNTAFIITKRELKGLKVSFARKNKAAFLNNLLKSDIFPAYRFFRFHF
ncbi:hypothetical protein SAMN05421593_3916 [Chryseobacterium culicis]|uniref:Uncharacterized protein n=1 Tax=Chryseobacterium culicis TaxID=680127 RepID=A0A1H6I624_CHRCI|nr:hypothetical protein SAMN05421593_3916 [Chryseobacterium culicis]